MVETNNAASTARSSIGPRITAVHPCLVARLVRRGTDRIERRSVRDAVGANQVFVTGNADVLNDGNALHAGGARTVVRTWIGAVAAAAADGRVGRTSRKQLRSDR